MSARKGQRELRKISARVQADYTVRHVGRRDIRLYQRQRPDRIAGDRIGSQDIIAQRLGVMT